MKKLLLLAILAIESFANAQYNPEVVGPLYTGSNINYGVRDLSASATLNNQLFFSLKRDDNTSDIIATDGTVGNTIVLKNIPIPHLVFFVAFDNHVYFGIRDTIEGVQLWKTDGTVNGTVYVATFGGEGYATNYTVIGNKLFFASDNSSTTFDDTQLYVLTAGSSTPLLLSSNLFNITDNIEYNGKFFFTASDVANQNSNRELYTSDGTITGTVMVKDINPGSTGSNPSGLILFQDKLFFGANDGTSGYEIWSTDGTDSGTQLLTDISPGVNDGFAGSTFKSGVYNGALYFNGISTQLWKTDGTPAGTQLVKIINPAGTYQLSGFVTVNNKLLLAADDGVHGTELWSSDGTPANTNLLYDVRPGLAFGIYDIFKKNLFCNNQLFFAGADQFGLNPWVTDGTVAGTHIVEDLVSTTNGDSVYNADGNYVLLNNKIYFSGKDSVGSQLYAMDFSCNLGTVSNEKNVFKVYPNPTSNFINIESEIAIDNTKIYNNLGHKVMQINGDKDQIDISQLPSGLYFLTATDLNKGVNTQKIIKR